MKAEILRSRDPERCSCEEELAREGRPLPLPHRFVWEEVQDGLPGWFLRLQHDAQACVFGCAVEVSRTRALPAHRILRVHRFGGAGEGRVLAAAVEALADAAKSDPLALRLHVEVFSRNPGVHEAVGSACRAAGFVEASAPRSYAETVVLDLSPDLEEVFASLHATGRRHIRAVKKNPVRIQAIDDPGLARRLDELMRQTMARTGGTHQRRDWARLISFCRRHPGDARLVGLFHTEEAGPGSLLAYTLGYNHGDHVEYASAASTRDHGLSMPLAYGLAWDLIAWAKACGAAWFDFGGITRGTHRTAEDPRGGISDFKRYFTRDVVRVGSEWILEPSPMRARLAGAVSAGASWLRKLRHTGAM